MKTYLGYTDQGNLDDKEYDESIKGYRRTGMVRVLEHNIGFRKTCSDTSQIKAIVSSDSKDENGVFEQNSRRSFDWRENIRFLKRPPKKYFAPAAHFVCVDTSW